MKRKIAVIGLKGLPAFGGAAAVGENIIDQLKDKYDFTVYAVSSHTDKKGRHDGYQQIVFKKFPIIKLNTLYYYFISILHAIFKGNYDLIHFHHTDAAFTIPILKLKYKVIATSHGRPQHVDKWSPLIKFFFKINEKIFLNSSTVITSVSMHLKNTYNRKSSRKIYYIPNGIKIDKNFVCKSIDSKDYFMFAAGRITATKGCHVFLEALNFMNSKIKTIIAGDLNQIPVYKNKIIKLSSTLDVDFKGLIKDKNLLMTYIHKAKFFIFPSFIEAMSMMMLEVASMKTPLICSDIPENKDVFTEHEVLFFKTGDSKDLAEKLEWALSNEEQMKKKAEKAYTKLSKEYLWERISRQYNKLYQELITKGDKKQ